MDPLEADIKELDAFEYVIKNLFILRSKPLKESLQILGPGAKEDLGPKLSHLLKSDQWI